MQPYMFLHYIPVLRPHIYNVERDYPHISMSAHAQLRKFEIPEQIIVLESSRMYTTTIS